MSIIKRGFVFTAITISNAILFLFHSRVLLEIVNISENFASGPATQAINLLPAVIQLAIGAIQIGVTLYFLAGLQRQRTVTRGPV